MKRISTIMIASLFVMGTTAVAQSDPVPGKNGNKYVPYEERTGNESIVYFTRNLSAEGLIEAYEQVSANIKGHTGVKLHTGEQNGPNIIPREWVKALFRKDLSDANIVETNTYYEGDRYTTEQHRRTLKVNGWTFCPVDILDEEDTLTLPVHGGKWFGKMSVGSHTTDYNSLVVLTHFKGHTQGGFGGSNKNIGIGCADGRIGKAWIHTNFLVGSHGASVPLPIFANNNIVHAARNNPAEKIRAPKTIGRTPLENDRLSVKNNIINGIVTVALNGSAIIAFNHDKLMSNSITCLN